MVKDGFNMTARQMEYICPGYFRRLEHLGRGVGA